MSEEEIKLKYTEDEMLGEHCATYGKKPADGDRYGRQESTVQICGVKPFLRPLQ